MSRTKKLIQYVLPSVLGMVSIFLFTIIDGIFVGRGVGTDALGAVNLAFPFIMLFSAIIMLATMGGLTITAIRIGRGDQDSATDSFMHSFLFASVVCVVMMLAGVCFPRTICRLMGANDTFIDMASEYLFWYSVFLIPCGMFTFFNGFARNDGAPVLVSFATILSTCLNIFGDWLFIFPLKTGLKGAAIATGISQTIGCLVVLVHFLRKKEGLRFKLFRPDGKLFRLIVLRGMPECISQFSVPVATILSNIVIAKYLGDAAVNAYSILCYAACFSVAVFAGVGEGIQPLLGTSYGAKDQKSLKFYFRTGFIISVTSAAALTVLLTLIWGSICTLFDADSVTRACAMEAMPRYSWGFVIQSMTVIISGYLYSTTRTKSAIFINILRCCTVNVAVILLLPLLFGSGAVWYTFGVYELIVLLAAVVLLVKEEKKGVLSGATE